MSSSICVRAALSAATAACTLFTAVPAAQAAPAANAAAQAHARVVAHWTPERRAAAAPRDLVLDERGQAYLRRANGSLEPYGHRVAAETPTPRAKPGSGDTTAPGISNPSPAAGTTIGASQTFSARIVDSGGLRSVRYTVQKSGSAAQSFTPTLGTGDVWSTTISGFTDGNWTWSIEAIDRAGNRATQGPLAFTVATGGGGGGGGGVVTNAAWTTPGALQTATGRIYFEMPSNSRKTRWAGYVCSGTVAADATTGRSTILTAAHCVYDDQYKAFARNVLFIPDQDKTTGAGTDRDCTNDPLGCWTPAFGVVDVNWTTRTFPDNVKWDYAFYVVNDAIDSHTGAGTDGALDALTSTVTIDFQNAIVDDAGTTDVTHALGYSYSDDPKFMYCAEDMTTEGTDNWWIPSCGLSGGSSGGPWVQPMGTGTGPVISVNSWGYTTSPGMAGPKLNGLSTAACVFSRAKARGFLVAPADGSAGYAETCP